MRESEEEEEERKRGIVFYSNNSPNVMAAVDAVVSLETMVGG